MRCVDGDERIVDCSISRVELVDDMKQVSYCLVLRQWALEIRVIVKQCWDEISRFQVGMSHENFDKIHGDMSNETATVTVEDLRLCLLFKNIQDFLPSFSLHPVTKNIIVVIHSTCKEE